MGSGRHAGCRRLRALGRGGGLDRQGVRQIPRAGGGLRDRHIARRPYRGDARRGVHRHLADEQHHPGQCRGPRLPGGAGGNAQAAQRLFARHRPVLSHRSGGGCLHRRHGGNARLGHQRGALRHHARERREPESGARQRRGGAHRQPRQEVVCRLRSHPPVRRLGRHAWRHHRDHPQAARHPAVDRRRGVPVSQRRGGLQRGNRHHPDGYSGGAHRTGRRGAGEGLQRLFQALI